ncbi:MAG: hypothetical protein CL946_05740 [Ectothiorhodospiraceae bacterium]|nr:hypothetical protein [Ectothiorhodospiraceae bacterium]
MTPETYLLVVVAGVLTGIVGGLFGIGGGAILVPILVVGFDLPMHEAIAASIVTVIATSSATASVYVAKGYSNVRLGMSLEVMTTIGALFGGITANLLPGDVLKKIFAVFMIGVGILMWIKNTRPAKPRVIEGNAAITGSYFDEAENRQVNYSVKRLPLAMAISTFAGNISGLLGIGGGLIKVPVMNLACGIPMKASTATSNFMIGVTAVASAFIYFAHGNVNPYYTATAVLGVLIGSRLGAKLGMKIHSKVIIALFILLIFGVAARMYFS